MRKITPQYIKQRLAQWAADTFEGAYATRVERSQFGCWNVRIEWDEEGYLEEIHSFAVEGNRFRSLGVTEIQA